MGRREVRGGTDETRPVSNDGILVKQLETRSITFFIQEPTGLHPLATAAAACEKNCDGGGDLE